MLRAGRTLRRNVRRLAALPTHCRGQRTSLLMARKLLRIRASVSDVCAPFFPAGQPRLAARAQDGVCQAAHQAHGRRLRAASNGCIGKAAQAGGAGPPLPCAPRVAAGASCAGAAAPRALQHLSARVRRCVHAMPEAGMLWCCAHGVAAARLPQPPACCLAVSGPCSLVHCSGRSSTLADRAVDSGGIGAKRERCSVFVFWQKKQ